MDGRLDAILQQALVFECFSDGTMVLVSSITKPEDSTPVCPSCGSELKQVYP